MLRDVMILSKIVEVKGDKVRLRDRHWERYVLKEAEPTSVNSDGEDHNIEEDEEDEDVVFVMEREGDVGSDGLSRINSYEMPLSARSFGRAA